MAHVSSFMHFYNLCINSPSKVNIGVLSEMEKCHFASLIPSHWAMMQPFTTMTSQIDCRSLVAPDVKQGFGCSRLSSFILNPLGLFSLPLSIISVNILFQRVSATPLPAIFLSPFLPKPTLLVVYIP